MKLTMTWEMDESGEITFSVDTSEDCDRAKLVDAFRHWISHRYRTDDWHIICNNIRLLQDMEEAVFAGLQDRYE